MEEHKKIEEIVRSEIKKRWKEIEARESEKYFQSPLRNFSQSRFVGFHAPDYYWVRNGHKTPFDYFFNEIINNVFGIARNEDELRIVLDAIFEKFYSRVINVGDSCDFGYEGYFPRTYIEIKEAIGLARDSCKLYDILKMHGV